MSFPSGLLDAFEHARRSIFRLETLQYYAGDPQFYRFQQGLSWEDNESKRHWTDIVRRRTADGVAMQRVHLIKHPLTDYVRFEIEWSYPHNVAAGEDVRIAVDGEWDTDFWLFDDGELWVMQYTPGGELAGAELVTHPEAVGQARQDKREALDASRSLEIQAKAS